MIGVDVPPIVVALAVPVAICLILLLLRRLARPHHLMYAEIRRRCADVQARAAQRAVVHDQTPAPRPSGDGSTGDGAGTPDPAPSPAPQRVHIEMGGLGRHRAA